MRPPLDAVFDAETSPVMRSSSGCGAALLAPPPAQHVMEAQPDPSPRLPRRPSLRQRREWMKLVYLGIVIVVVMAFRSSVVDWNDVMTGSMAPTILPGDRFLVNKLAYGVMIPFTEKYLFKWGGGPRRGDIVIFTVRLDGEEVGMVKRIVGVPGDVISYRRGRLTINKETVEYAPLPESMQIDYSPYDRWKHETALELLGNAPHPVLHTPAAPGPSFFPTRVPPGQYFVMGDNRDNSEDSRFFGFVPREHINGRVTHVVFSLDPDQGFKPRENRAWDRLP